MSFREFLITACSERLEVVMSSYPANYRYFRREEEHWGDIST